MSKLSLITFSVLILLGCGCQPNLSDNDIVAKKYHEAYRNTKVSDEILNDINFLLITSDQHHWITMGYNDSTIRTPNLDRLAKNGIIFDRAYCPNPTCTPTRASIITGMMPGQHGAYVLGTKLPENVPTVGEDFAAHGYETTLIGKAHFQLFRGNAEFPSLEAYPILQDLDFWKEFHGPFYGFNHIELARNHGDEAHVGHETRSYSCRTNCWSIK